MPERPANLPVAAPDHAEIVRRALDTLAYVSTPTSIGEKETREARESLTALLAERQQDKERIEAADRWLEGLESSYASPNRECEDEDVASGGTREGNTCIDSTEHDLLFPDDWCMRCYSLHVVRQARAALAVEEDAKNG